MPHACFRKRRSAQPPGHRPETVATSAHALHEDLPPRISPPGWPVRWSYRGERGLNANGSRGGNPTRRLCCTFRKQPEHQRARSSASGALAQTSTPTHAPPGCCGQAKAAAPRHLHERAAFKTPLSWIPELSAMSTYGGSKCPGERARIFTARAGAEGRRYLTASTLVVEVDTHTRRGLLELVGNCFGVGLRREQRVALGELRVRPRHETNRSGSDHRDDHQERQPHPFHGIPNLAGRCRFEAIPAATRDPRPGFASTLNRWPPQPPTSPFRPGDAGGAAPLRIAASTA
jgi:hypothetical protein